MNKIDVLLDCDGVLRDIHSQLIEEVPKFFPEAERVKTVDEIVQWDLGALFGIDGDEFEEFMFIDAVEEIFFDAKPYKGAEEFVDKLSKEKDINLLLVSSQREGSREITLKWLDKYFRNKFDDIIFTVEKFKVKPFSDDISSRVLLDDKEETLDEVEELSDDIVVVCMSRTWNQGYEGIRVETYEEFFEILEEIKK